jgi:hypothetical protein
MEDIVLLSDWVVEAVTGGLLLRTILNCKLNLAINLHYRRISVEIPQQ